MINMRRMRAMRWLMIVTLASFAAAIASYVSPSTGMTAHAHALSQQAAPPPDSTGRGHGHTFQDGHVLVAFASGASARDISRLEHTVNARESRELGVDVHLLAVPNGQELSIVNLLNASPLVRYAEPDYLMELAGIPNDPNFSIQWAYQNTGQTVKGVAGTPNDDERATAAWNVTTGSKNIVIGETDTGVQYTHPDLAANIWTNPGGIGGCAAGTHGYNVLTHACDPMDDDTQYGGHGTHVAGIMGAAGDNGIGVTGVNWNTTILPVKWVTSTGGNTTSNLIAALDWMLQAQAAGVNLRVINDSTVFVGTAYSQALSDEISKLGQHNILFVTAAGNTSGNNDNPAVRRYPCGYDLSNEICVAASDQNDNLPSWANYGASTVDLAAPGNNIYSTLLNSSYGYINGSSMASPQVAGAAALILSVKDMTPAQLKADILENVDVTPGLSGVVRSNGRLDICRALPGCVAPTLPLPVLGQRAVGPSVGTLSADTKYANHYELSTGASVSKLSLYLQPTSTSGQQSLEGVIYADRGGVPGAQVAVTTPTTFASTNSAGWYDLPFSSAVSLNPGWYWVGVISGSVSGVAGFRWLTVPGSRASNGNAYASGPSDPFGSATIDNDEISLYATYTATAPGAGIRPFSVTPPAITGAPGQAGPIIPVTGQALNATTGVWDNSPTSYAYQWSRCASTGLSCTPISGATTSSYMPVAADVNGTVRVSVTATNSAGSATDTSSASQVVTTNSIPNTFGKTTIGKSSDSSGSNAERVEVFQVSQSVSVTKLTIYLRRNMSGSQVLKGVIYSDAGGAPNTLLGVTDEFTFSTTATTGWYDLTFPAAISVAPGSYWIGLIDGASASVFALAYDSAQPNASDLVRPQYTSGPPNPFGTGSFSTEQVSLYATYSTTPSPPPSPPANTTPPTISGTAQVGQTLTASTGAWTNSPVSYAYQWSDCDITGANCVAISGATAASYSPVSGDVGSTLAVAVRATNAGGSATARSAATAAVAQAPSGGTFGLTTVGANHDTMGANRKRVNNYQVGSNVNVTKLTMYLAPGSASGTQLIEPVIYTDQSGAPGALIAVGSEFTFSSTDTAGWYDLTFTAPVALTPGAYWIGVISGANGGVTGFRWKSVPQSRAYNSNPYTSGPSNSFGAATIDSEQMSLYATYS